MFPNNIIKAQILSCFNNPNELIKSEGDRGGKVIGHTKSGKPIYDSFNHPTHTHFTKQDHFDANSIHSAKQDDILSKRNKVKNSDKRDEMMDDAAHHAKQEDLHFNKYKEMPENVDSDDEDDEEVYQRKQQEKRDKESEGRFTPDDVLALKSPHVNFTTEVSFRGYMGENAVVFDKKNGSQFTVPKAWLTKK